MEQDKQISPEQALKVFDESDGYKDQSGRYVFETTDELTAFANAAITKYFGERYRERNPFCEDEGCPHYGTKHICIDSSRERNEGEAVYQYGYWIDDRETWFDTNKEGYDEFNATMEFETRVLYTTPPSPSRELLEKAKKALLDANRNGFTRGLEVLAEINSALALLPQEPKGEGKS